MNIGPSISNLGLGLLESRSTQAFLPTPNELELTELV